MHVELDLLRALDALVRHRSVTLAGRELGLTQSATSHALARLRAAFDDELLVRGGSAMVPTAVAEQLAQRARRILNEVADLTATRATFEPRTARRTFAIAMSDGGQLLVLPALLADLAEHAPGIAIAVRRRSDRDDALLESGELALALGGPLGARLYRQTLIEDHLVWAVRREHRGKARLSLAEYARRGRVQIALRSEPAVDQALAADGLSIVSVTVHSLLAALMIVLRSDRVLTLSNETARALEDTMRIRVLPTAIELPRVAIGQQWHARHHDDPGHVWLRQRIKHLCDRRAWRR